MARPFTGKTNVATYEDTKPNGVVYIYERTTWYDQSKGYTCASKKLLGKKDPITGEIQSTRPKKDGRSNEELSEDSIVIVGKKENALISIVQHLSSISGVTAEVKAALRGDRGTAEKMLTLAWYAFATEGRTWTRAENWTRAHMTELPYSYGPITESIYQQLFHYLGEHEEIKWAIFIKRAEKLGDGELLALDSTLIVCENSSVADAKKTKNKEGMITGAYKVVYLYSITARQLIAYAKIPGNIPDCSTVQYALDQFKALKLKGNIEIIQDNGYATEQDIGQYLHSKRHFITRLEPNCSWIRDDVNKYLSEVKNDGAGTEILRADPEFTGVHVTVNRQFPYIRKYGSNTKGLKAGDIDQIEASINVFILYSSYKKGIDDSKLRQQIINAQKDLEREAVLDDDLRKIADNYIKKEVIDGRVVFTVDMHKYKESLKYHGLLVIAADKEKDINQALVKYRSRETIEEGIEGHKGHTGGDSRKCGNDDSVDGELLIEFLGDSMRESFRSRLRIMDSTLAVTTGDQDHDQSRNLKDEAKVKRLIRKKSMAFILESFDRKYVSVVKHGKKTYEITVPQTRQDAIFLKGVGVIE